jgi:hypothetical protein
MTRLPHRENQHWSTGGAADGGNLPTAADARLACLKAFVLCRRPKAEDEARAPGADVWARAISTLAAADRSAVGYCATQATASLAPVAGARVAIHHQTWQARHCPSDRGRDITPLRAKVRTNLELRRPGLRARTIGRKRTSAYAQRPIPGGVGADQGRPGLLARHRTNARDRPPPPGPPVGHRSLPDVLTSRCRLASTRSEEKEARTRRVKPALPAGARATHEGRSTAPPSDPARRPDRERLPLSPPKPPTRQTRQRARDGASTRRVQRYARS